jgi:hypothetical protein
LHKDIEGWMNAVFWCDRCFSGEDGGVCAYHRDERDRIRAELSERAEG